MLSVSQEPYGVTTTALNVRPHFRIHWRCSFTLSGEEAISCRDRRILIGHALYAVAWLPSFTAATLTQFSSLLFILLALTFTPFIIRYTDGFMKKSSCGVYSRDHSYGNHQLVKTALTGDARYVVGAAMFALSDVSVALDRFTPIPRWHRWLGIPLYFVSQYILASTLVGV